MSGDLTLQVRPYSREPPVDVSDPQDEDYYLIRVIKSVYAHHCSSSVMRTEVRTLYIYEEISVCKLRGITEALPTVTEYAERPLKSGGCQ